jgi:hypothetical protein
MNIKLEIGADDSVLEVLVKACNLKNPIGLSSKVYAIERNIHCGLQM